MLITELAQNLQFYRDCRGINQDELAFRAGISVKTLSNIECGRGNPTFVMLNTLADVLGIELAHLLRSDPSVDYLRPERELASLQPLFDRLSHDHQTIIMTLLKVAIDSGLHME